MELWGTCSRPAAANAMWCHAHRSHGILTVARHAVEGVATAKTRHRKIGVAAKHSALTLASRVPRLVAE